MIFKVLITAYCLCSLCTHYKHGITKSGNPVEENLTAACGPELYGKVIHVEGFGVFFCEDTGRLIGDKHVDIYMKEHTQALKVFSKRTVRILGDWRNGTVGDRKKAQEGSHPSR